MRCEFCGGTRYVGEPDIGQSPCPKCNSEATQGERDKIAKALEGGRVQFRDPEALARMRKGPAQREDFDITSVEVSFWGPSDRNQGGIEILWSTKAAGFGGTTVCLTNEGKLRCDNEGMGKEFIATVFAAVLEQMELMDS